MVRRARGKTDAQTQIAFLKQFEALLVGLYPAKTRPVIIADGEFHAVELMRYLDGMGWGFRLRLHRDTLVHLPGGPGEGSICSLAEIGLRPRARQYLQGVYLTARHAYGPISIATYWATGEDAPWFIVTDEDEASYRTLEDYSRRRWTEELFNDLQGSGLHRSRLHQPARISRLLLAVCLVYLWLVHVGAYVIKQGPRALVDRSDRRDCSLAEIGRH